MATDEYIPPGSRGIHDSGRWFTSPLRFWLKIAAMPPYLLPEVLHVAFEHEIHGGILYCYPTQMCQSGEQSYFIPGELPWRRSVEPQCAHYFLFGLKGNREEGNNAFSLLCFLIGRQVVQNLLHIEA